MEEEGEEEAKKHVTDQNKVIVGIHLKINDPSGRDGRVIGEIRLGDCVTEEWEDGA